MIQIWRGLALLDETARPADIEKVSFGHVATLGTMLKKRPRGATSRTNKSPCFGSPREAFIRYDANARWGLPDPFLT